MTTVPDNEFFNDAERLKGKEEAMVSENPLHSFSHVMGNAKIVIADRDIEAANQVIEEIENLGSQAIAQKCDVTSWQAQLEVFQRAIREYGTVDVVVANAGILEKGRFVPAELDSDNVPIKPSLTTVHVNLQASKEYRLVRYTQPQNTPLLGFRRRSMGFTAIKFVWLLYVLGSQVNSDSPFLFFWVPTRGSDTSIMVTPMKIFLAGIPLTPVERVAGTVIKAATETNPDTNGSVYTIPDGGETFRLDRKDLSITTGVYKLLGDRADAFLVYDFQYFISC
ncbi:hypothetical protein Clacol_000488 [Clathrus columnatus]|uniref:Uncharacterized protein n=1 Tax=Clathrus columnatus TaxID=1419009 RepID=A0AAV4ZYV3_9AGAM|nr:hypothetical protein Clacol_000488 [Clathrus columnatus]